MALLAYVIVLFICSLTVSEKIYEKNSRVIRILLDASSFLMNIFLRIHVHVSGIEKVPADTRFLLVANHLSNFDPIISWWVFRKYDVAYISKPENFKVPIYGKLIRKCCFMPIDRANPAQAAKTLKLAEQFIKADEVSIGVYPEGTRGSGQELGEFHNGMFHIAKSTGVPIVVTTIRGTQNIHKNTPWHRTDVYVEVVDIIDVEFCKAHRTSEIGERIREKMQSIYPIENK